MKTPGPNPPVDEQDEPGSAAARSPEAGTPPPDEPGAGTVLLRIAALAAAIRVVLWSVGTVAISGIPGRGVLDMWTGWDAHHYLRIAEVGYKSSGEDGLYIVFFPLYPLLVRIVSFVVPNLVVSALAVSFVASVGAGWFLYRLARLDTGHREAWGCVLLLFAFPTAFFLAAPYTEALFLTAVLASVYAARTSAWGWSGIAGAAATATRVAGAALIPGLLAEAVAGLRDRDGRELGRRVAWTLLVVPLGFAGYLALNQVVYGDPFRFLEIQAGHWSQRLVPPWVPLREALGHVTGPDLRGDYAIIFWGRLLGFAAGAAVLLAGWRRLRPADRVYGWAALILVTSASWLLSLPRYLLGIYPLFLVLGRVTSKKPVMWGLCALGAAAQVVFFWRFARGAWTF